jgi:NAD(P)-dependent dehydrogenase (short-subunit alcohol dehydrogenase family)
MPVIEQIRRQTNNQNLVFMKLELSNYDSVREFVTEFRKSYKQLNILVNNAGTANTSITLDSKGHDVNFTTNYLGPFLLTALLLDVLKNTNESRVVNVSALAHTFITAPVNFEEILKGKSKGILGSY